MFILCFNITIFILIFNNICFLYAKISHFRYARGFWLILILLAFAFLAYEVYRTIADFINNPVITTYVLTPQDSIEFPKLFICPSVMLTNSYVQQDRQKTADILRFLEQVQLIESGNISRTASCMFFTRAEYSKLCIVHCA